MKRSDTIARPFLQSIPADVEGEVRGTKRAIALGTGIAASTASSVLPEGTAAWICRPARGALTRRIGNPYSGRHRPDERWG